MLNESLLNLQLVQRPVMVYFEEFRYCGNLHCYPDLRLIDELNKKDRRFVPLTTVQVMPVSIDTVVQEFQYTLLGKKGFDFMSIDTIEPFLPAGMTPDEEEVVAVLPGYKLQGILRRQKAFRLVDSLNAGDFDFFDLFDVNIYARQTGTEVKKIGFVSSVIVNKSRVAMIVPMS